MASRQRLDDDDDVAPRLLRTFELSARVERRQDGKNGGKSNSVSGMLNLFTAATEWRVVFMSAAFNSIDTFFFIRICVPLFFTIMWFYLLPRFVTGPDAEALFQGFHAEVARHWWHFIVHIRNLFELTVQNTAAGRAILHRTGTATELRALDGQRSLPPEVRSKITANPIPKHMSHELHEGRRKARVNRQRRQFKSDPYVQYVDVAAYPAGGLFAVAAVNGRDNSLTLAASVRAEHPAAAETIAAALVIKQHDRTEACGSGSFSHVFSPRLCHRNEDQGQTESVTIRSFSRAKFLHYPSAVVWCWKF
ncbi:hypothetical protein HPB49_017058 [Dermacentor silvarum]|uniref:Uncharacterized protein n=1 Tax=Dermacentor silvarum TaxID=543639 RepID=A0ACB8D703_DERSI|nr:hypothetical protein HPB49_017058 [Dermacentor silvarum]